MHDKIESNRNVKLKVLYSLRWYCVRMFCVCVCAAFITLFFGTLAWQSNFVYGIDVHGIDAKWMVNMQKRSDFPKCPKSPIDLWKLKCHRHFCRRNRIGRPFFILSLIHLLTVQIGGHTSMRFFFVYPRQMQNYHITIIRMTSTENYVQLCLRFCSVAALNRIGTVEFKVSLEICAEENLNDHLLKAQWMNLWHWTWPDHNESIEPKQNNE